MGKKYAKQVDRPNPGNETVKNRYKTEKIERYQGVYKVICTLGDDKTKFLAAIKDSSGKTHKSYHKELKDAAKAADKYLIKSGFPPANYLRKFE